VLTKGTFTSQNETKDSYLPNYLLALRTHAQHYGFALLDIGTSEIAVGIVDDLEKFKTVLYQTRPVELVYDPDNVSFEVCGMMEKTFLHMQMSKVPNLKNIWHPLQAQGELDRLATANHTQKPKIFEVIDLMPDTEKNILYATLSGLFGYLQKVLKFEYVMGSVKYTFYQRDTHTKNMILDSQALQHLEIFETPDGVAGSLFSIIDRTKTKFGRRLLRKWLMCPLMNVFHIEQRLNAIEDFDAVKLEKEQVCGLLKELPDLDKKINKLYHYAVKTTSASKAVYFEDFNKARLKEFKETMEKLEIAWDAVGVLRKCASKFRSVRLRQLVTMGNELKINDEDIYIEDEDDQSNLEGLLPDVIANL
jgi:DNA mismatch repair ATPase MutS